MLRAALSSSAKVNACILFVTGMAVSCCDCMSPLKGELSMRRKVGVHGLLLASHLYYPDNKR